MGNSSTNYINFINLLKSRGVPFQYIPKREVSGTPVDESVRFVFGPKRTTNYLIDAKNFGRGGSDTNKYMGMYFRGNNSSIISGNHGIPVINDIMQHENIGHATDTNKNRTVYGPSLATGSAQEWRANVVKMKRLAGTSNMVSALSLLGFFDSKSKKVPDKAKWLSREIEYFKSLPKNDRDGILSEIRKVW